ncbi:hypothetical protein AAF712_011114 [Marasmius tenuissimus]|uniref:Uncharacterized protein n=1 Tax=Marasmius tenuissimus TaxID=585030 RepID=A0ABR2ZKE0_9AGAR
MGSSHTDLVDGPPKPALTTQDSTSTLHSPHGDFDVEDLQFQTDILARLRVIEQLQSYTLPRFRSSIPDDILTDILNWISLCFCPNASDDDVAVALAIYRGQISLFVANTPNSPSTSSLNLTKNVVRTTLKKVLSDDSMAPPTAARLFSRMIVDIGHPRLQRKITLLGRTSGDPQSTGLRFASLVKSWLFYRPDGERSKGFVNRAVSLAGNATNTTDYMVRSFWVIVEQANFSTDGMPPDQRYTYLTSMMTACDLLVKSTFFNDLLNHHTFRVTLEDTDRLFLHTLLRRLSHIASYKTGAAKFAVIGIPFIHTILGDSGVEAFLEDEERGGIVFELVSEWQDRSRSHPLAPSSTTRSFTWQASPLDFLPSALGLDGRGESDGHNCGHSRNTSSTSAGTDSSSNTSESTSSIGSHLVNSYGELNRLDEELQIQFLSSSVVADAWTPGDTITATYHSILQLISYLESLQIDILGQTIGTSKPICWMCVRYIHALEQYCAVKDDENDREEREKRQTFGHPSVSPIDDRLEKIHKKWYMSKGSGKVRDGWLIPSGAPREVIDTIIEDAQQEMVRIVEDVAFDGYTFADPVS